MKKVVFCLLAFLTLGSQSRAQEGYVGISIGPSIPMGDFSSKDIDNDEPGWANTGALFDISFAYELGKSKFGITALLRGQSNLFDEQAYEDELDNQFPGVHWTVKSGAWEFGSFMFGGFGSFPISEKSSFDIRALIGFVRARSPELSATLTGPGGTEWIKQGSSSATSFAYLIGAGFKFDMGTKLYLLTNLDYTGFNPEFSNVEIMASDGSRDFDTWSQTINTLNLSVGIALKF